jgi:large subunit ribosomal protein L9e
MKQIYKEEELVVPAGVTVAIKARVITVVGPRGTLLKVSIGDSTPGLRTAR